MTSFVKGLLLISLICLAILFYMVGSVTGAIAFIVMGCALEVAFWFGILGKTNKGSSAD